MADFTTSKVDGNTVDAPEWNQLADLDNAVTASNQTPSTGNLNQLGIAMAINAAGADFYSDSGTANAYVLTAIGTLRSPHAYFDGMRARFRPDNANTGASTVNVATLGVKSIKRSDGTTATSTGDIVANADLELRYDLANGVFVITNDGYKLKSFQTFTSSGTWTKPGGIKAVLVEVCGGGGGGAGAGTAAFAAGGGGGGGGFAQKLIISGLGSTETITVGAGGTAGSVGLNNGGNGGTSSFGSHVSATGGSGGVSTNSATASSSQAGASGLGVSGDINYKGFPASCGIGFSSQGTVGGSGGSSKYGGGAIAGAVNAAGIAATGYGGGGSGAGNGVGTGNAGGAGFAGLVIVYEYV